MKGVTWHIGKYPAGVVLRSGAPALMYVGIAFGDCGEESEELMR